MGRRFEYKLKDVGDGGADLWDVGLDLFMGSPWLTCSVLQICMQKTGRKPEDDAVWRAEI